MMLDQLANDVVVSWMAYMRAVIEESDETYLGERPLTQTCLYAESVAMVTRQVIDRGVPYMTIDEDLRDRTVRFFDHVRLHSGEIPAAVSRAVKTTRCQSLALHLAVVVEATEQRIKEEE